MSKHKREDKTQQHLLKKTEDTTHKVPEVSPPRNPLLTFPPLLALIVSIASFLTAFLSYRVSDKSLKQVQRAYTTVDCQVEDAKDYTKYRVYVRNLGNTPALKVTAHATGFGFYSAERLKDMQTIGPKDEKMLVKIEEKPEIAASHKTGLRGAVMYDDIFGVRHSDEFCFQAMGPDVYICDDSKAPPGAQPDQFEPIN
ncbi:MAG TPA: hypothetical protein VNY51_13815 [Candidatus Dormibacteraeota bacterium]|jgi:hypothetical protein|nr:hypothetical protein [Candidatus Dormibacteraeota bacterium]